MVRRVGAVLKSDTAVILFRDENALRPHAAFGFDRDVQRDFTVEIGCGFSGRIAASGLPEIIHDTEVQLRATDPIYAS
jgi:hypothetical protein